jgi:hypothetical protein
MDDASGPAGASRDTTHTSCTPWRRGSWARPIERAAEGCKAVRQPRAQVLAHRQHDHIGRKQKPAKVERGGIDRRER